MKASEKQRLTAVTRKAVAEITCGHPHIKACAEKVAARYSPTNANQHRDLAQIVWWLIAANADDDALALVSALCEIDGGLYYWMPHALASAFATRAWLHARRKQDAAARADAKTALAWIGRDPNGKPVTQAEVRKALERFDAWLKRAAGETKAIMRALRVMAHGLRVLVMYQQFAKAGDKAAKTIPAREFTRRMSAGLAELRRRIESL